MYRLIMFDRDKKDFLVLRGLTFLCGKHLRKDLLVLLN